MFLAEDASLGRQVVVKVLPAEMAVAAQTDRFRREIQVAARLQHPHIVPVHAAGAAGTVLYYTMPYVAGESLRARLDHDGALPSASALRIWRDVLDALAYAHSRGIVHRDVKPDNILIDGRHALVTDFGIARALEAATGDGEHVTSTGMVLGTPAYMAPEQVAADPAADHRVDIYSLGIVAWEIVVGRRRSPISHPRSSSPRTSRRRPTSCARSARSARPRSRRRSRSAWRSRLSNAFRRRPIS